MSPRFTPVRDDGRSDGRVVFDLVEAAEPETRFSYGELIDALSEGLDRKIDRNRVYRAVGAANKVLLRERKRYLSVIENEGYRVIRSDEHLPVALDRKGRAETHLKAGMELLRNARLDELDQHQRALHEGQLLILGGLVEAMRESTRRHDRIEKLVEGLTERVGQLEQRP
jgi:hypothetical protein